MLSHAQALLTSSPEGQTDYIQADLRDTATIVEGAVRTLDLTRPVAVLLIAVLHFIPDADYPDAVAGAYGYVRRQAHRHRPLSDIAPDALAQTACCYNAMSSTHHRTRAQVARFFDGLDLLPPGLVPISQWGLSGQIDPATGGLVGDRAIARKS